MKEPAEIIDFRVRPPVASFTRLDIFPKPEETGSPYFKWHSELPQSVRKRDMGLFLKELDEAGVVHSVMWGRRVSSNPAQSSTNEDIGRIHADHPGKFSAFGGVSLPDAGQSIASSVAQVEDALITHKMKGITVEPGTYPPLTTAEDRRLYPVYSRCQELGGILAMTMSRTRAPGANLIHAGVEGVDQVARDFPGLNIVVSHSFWPNPEISVGLAYRRRNIHLVPDLYSVGMPGYELWIEAANTFMPDRLIFASAYPLLGTVEVARTYRDFPFDPGVVEKVMYGNAARLLGL